MIMHFIHKIQLGSIEVSIATMRKSDRSKVDEVYVCGFVPSYLLPNKCPVSLESGRSVTLIEKCFHL